MPVATLAKHRLPRVAHRCTTVVVSPALALQLDPPPHTPPLALHPRTTTTVAAAAPLSPLHRHHPHRHAPSPPRPSRPISIAAAALSPPYPRLSCRVTPRTPQGGAHAPPLGPFYPPVHTFCYNKRSSCTRLLSTSTHPRPRAPSPRRSSVARPTPPFLGDGVHLQVREVQVVENEKGSANKVPKPSGRSPLSPGRGYTHRRGDL